MTPRDAEIARYIELYAAAGSRYRATQRRLDLYRALLEERLDRVGERLLDVGAGHGTMVAIAAELGHKALGAEVVPDLCRRYGHVLAPAWRLPYEDGFFDTVTCFDVLEHLLPEDVPAALRELARVASHRILVEVSCRPSRWRDEHGQLHMTIWEPDRWAGALALAWGSRFSIRARADRGLESAAAVFEGLIRPPATTSGAAGA